jgi:hypothetical protein
MRLQHGRSHALYRDPPQATRAILIVSGFRNTTQKLRLADGGSATIASATSAVGMSYGGYHQSVEEHQGCGNYE